MNNEVTQKVNQLKEKIDAFQSSSLSKKEKKLNGFNILTLIISDMLGGLLVGAGIGYLLVKVFGWHILVLGAFILLGGLAGLFNLYQSLKICEKEK